MSQLAQPPSTEKSGQAAIQRDPEDDNPQAKLSEASQKRWEVLADDVRELLGDISSAHLASGQTSPTRAGWVNYLGGPLLQRLGAVSNDVALASVEGEFKAFHKRAYDESIAAGEKWVNLEKEYSEEFTSLPSEPDSPGDHARQFLQETYSEARRKLDAGAIHFLVDDDFSQLKAVMDNDTHLWVGELRAARQRNKALLQMLDVVEQIRFAGKDEDTILPGWDDAVLNEREELQGLMEEAPTADYVYHFQVLLSDLNDARSQALEAKPREKGAFEKAFLFGKGAVSAVVDPLIEAGKQLVDLGQIGLHFLTLGKYEPEFISDLAEAAEEGATTTDLLAGMAKGLIETPERWLKAVEDGDWEAIGRETTNLYMLAKAGKAGAARASKMLRWAKARALAMSGRLGEGVTINFSKQLSSSGFKGTLAGRPGFGVFEGTHPQLSKPVAVKVYPEGMSDMFLDDLTGARAAARTGMGPKFYGEVPAGPGKRAFAMEKVEGGFAENLSEAPRGSAEWAAAEREATFYKSRVTDRTALDVEKYGRRLVRRGYYYDGEVQGLVTKSGRWRPIDFQAIRKLPSKKDVAAYKEALEMHESMIELEAKGYRNATKAPAPVP